MRLLTKNTIVYLAAALVVFLLGGFVFYYQLNRIIDEEATESLLLKKEQVFLYIGKNNQLPESSLLNNEVISFSPSVVPVKETMTDTTVFSAAEKELLPYRQLAFPVKISGQYYKAVISKPLFESDDLIEAITMTLIIISAALLIIILTVNYLFSKNIWKPFFKTIHTLNNYDIEKHQAIVSEKSNILEFRQLDEAIEKMTSKLSADFQNLKAFTENASHEIQTPLAIIKTKLELLIQSEHHNKEEMLAIQSVYEAANRLSKLNQSLILLTKIENHQFAHKERIDLSVLLQKRIANYSELIDAKEIKLTLSVEDQVWFSGNPSLIDTLFNNLITNAIKHNKKEGHITIRLTQHDFIISNTGTALKSRPEELFERFKKDQPASDSLGLGLSIVKKIAETEQLKIEYSYQEERHTVRVQF